jgi:hypothetical protein
MWYFVWPCVGLCGPVWSLLGVLVFELVALVRRITVVTNAKAPVAIGGHEPGLAGGRSNGLYDGRQGPLQRWELTKLGKCRPGTEVLLLSALPESSRAALQKLASGRGH